MIPVKCANNIIGTLHYSFDGNYFIRVLTKNGYQDFYLKTSDMMIQILDDDAWFYKTENGDLILDHSPETLGITAEIV